ncbi:heparinase II/III family protein [Hungatella sp. L12]|uniref:Heparinase II/III family protein n=1 Tax=Hungatella hominis TaxID=2763050 RepID=A0ABR7H8U4_9FIRM|nr:heparinase II/III family protein [Hungatella hominis]MBC5709599.1 heparinase II/III family protein [Hungatella hominis]
MNNIPGDETLLTDNQLFEALDLNLPGLSEVKYNWARGNAALAKKALVKYFEQRTQVTYFYDCRSLPLKRMEPDELPYAYQSSLGLRGSLKDFCLQSGRSMMEHRYLLPGARRSEDLGPSYENMIHFNFLKDQGKRHRHSLDMFVRGQFFEALSVLYHEEGDTQVIATFTELVHKFFETYPLIVEDPSAGANRFQYTEDRDAMSVGWLTIVLISLFYTRLPYETDIDTAFDLLKHIWFLGIQFKRFEEDGYRPYNHHMWERGLVPFLLSILLPEIPDFRAYRERGAGIVCRHIKEDFNEDGGYSEHSIAYWSGAAIGEMLFRGIYLANLNEVPLLDEESQQKIYASFSLLSMLTPPGPLYPSLGDNGGPLADPILQLGIKMLSHPMCTELERARMLQKDADPEILPRDFCSTKAGFLCSRSSYRHDGNYILMSAKTGCGCSGHNHMDLLSLFLTFRGQAFIGEPYTDKLYHSIRMNSELRGYMYNMTSHNTVLAHGEPVLPDCVYANKWGVYRPDTPVTEYWTDPKGIYVKAHHDAYTYCRHTRRILFHRTRGLIIRDEMERGNRRDKPHIQRWHLEPGTVCRILNNYSVLMEKNGVSLLWIWTDCCDIRLWKNTSLCPEIYGSEDMLAPILDVSFLGPEDKKVDIGTITLDLLILDVTDGTWSSGLGLHSLRTKLREQAPAMDEKLSLECFPAL